MILYTNGCSFTWGDELSDRNLRFAGLLANKFNCQLVDNSMCGASNERILRTTLDYLQNPFQIDHIFVFFQDHLK